MVALEQDPAEASGRPVSFLTNQARVLLAVARTPDARVRDIAREVGITERAVQLIIRELADEGHVEILKEGRRNRYRLPRRSPHVGERRLAVELARVFTD
ncbi:MAG TPA: helix-turn-helix domain-containing protein [Acidimicrobiales bacterium]|nr:helix-turn-helix domain-containing protein [Acidimicrobiales bacterium]